MIHSFLLEVTGIKKVRCGMSEMHKYYHLDSRIFLNIQVFVNKNFFHCIRLWYSEL